MPVFEYKCQTCERKYEVLHLVREKVEDVVCPECNSREYKRWFSPTNISSSSYSAPDCSDGSCGMNEGSCSTGMCPTD